MGPVFTYSGPAPICSDSELITRAIVGECKGWNQETELNSNWKDYHYLFPHIPERTRFNRRRRNLMGAINQIRQALLSLLDLAQDQQMVWDSLLLPVLEFSRAHFASSRAYCFELCLLADTKP